MKLVLRGFLLLVFFVFSMFWQPSSFAMTSTNYIINWDSMNSGGSDFSTSSNYKTHNTFGGQGVGSGTSTNFQINAGYRGGDAVTSTISPICGNGVIEAGEQCDNGGSNGACPQTCSAICIVNSSCGGGVPPPPPPPPPPKKAPPVISNIQASNITANSVHISWITDVPSDTSVSYGVTLQYASGTVSNPGLVTIHAIDLNSLTGGTLYHFFVQSSIPGELSSFSTDQIFTTLDDHEPPIISQIQVSEITDNSAKVSWVTNEPATSVVNYGITDQYGLNVTDISMPLLHFVVLNNLLPNHTYHFSVSSKDSSDNLASGDDGMFQTLVDVTPPPNVSAFTASPGNGAITLSWKNPPGLDFAGVKIVRKLAGPPVDQLDGSLVYSGNGNGVLDADLDTGTTYYYGAYAFDAAQNFASGALAEGTPQAPSKQQDEKKNDASSPNVIENNATSTPTVPGLTATTTPALQAQIVVHFFASGGALELTQDAQGRIGVLAGSVLSVQATTIGKSPEVYAASIRIGSEVYMLQSKPGTADFVTTLIVPSPGLYATKVSFVFSDNTAAERLGVVYSQGSGRVVEATLSGFSDVGISDATVQLFREDEAGWNPYGMQAQTTQDGWFAFMVPNGKYYLEIDKAGYRKTKSAPEEVQSNVFHPTLSLIRLPHITQVSTNAGVLNQLLVRTRNAQEQMVYNLNIARQVLQDPRVQTVNGIATPLVFAMTLVNTASTISVFNLLAYLQYLFTQPILLLGRRKRYKWGVVFNSLTKQPVDLAIIRLLQAETRMVLQTRVTDKLGRYFFFIKPGNYLIEVAKPGYIFPTEYLKDRNEDADFVDLHHGGVLAIKEDAALFSNIPVDPAVSVETPRRVLMKKFLLGLRQALAFSAIPLGMITVVVTPGITTASILMAQIGVYVLFRRIAVPAKAKSWGITFDAKTRQPIHNAIVRIFDKKFNKLLETQVTDRNGKYGFFVRRNVYYIMAEKAGYQKYTSLDLDLSNKEQAVIDQNIELQKMA